MRVDFPLPVWSTRIESVRAPPVSPPVPSRVRSSADSPARESLPTRRTLRPLPPWGRSPSGVASTRATSFHAELTAHAMLPPQASRRTSTTVRKVRSGRRRGAGRRSGRPAGRRGPPPPGGGVRRCGRSGRSGVGREAGVPAGITRVRGSSTGRRADALGREGVARGRWEAPERWPAEPAGVPAAGRGRWPSPFAVGWRGRSRLPVGMARASSLPRRPLRTSKVIASSSGRLPVGRSPAGRRGRGGRSGMPRRI